MPYRVFLSHATADRSIAEDIRAHCAKLEVDVYLCEHDVRPGFNLADKIEGQMDQCEAVIILLTPHSLQSNYVHQEIGMARAKKKVIIPLMEKGADPTKLGMLTGVEWIYFDPDEPQAAFMQVSQYLQARKRDVEAQADMTLIVLLGIVFAIIAVFAAESSRKA